MQARSIRRFFWVALSALLLLLGTAGCRETAKNSLDSKPVAFTKEGELRILEGTSDSVLVSLDIEISSTDYEIQTGLMYRKDMEDRQGMLFVFPEASPHSFYMKNTLIPLDILFIDEALEIVRIHRNAAPLDESGIPSGGAVQYVLEVKAGMSDRWGISEGDRIEYKKDP